MDHQKSTIFWFLALFLLEAVEAMDVTFNQIEVSKIKFPHLINVQIPILWLKSVFLMPNKWFEVWQSMFKHPVEFASICRICNLAPIPSKGPFWFTEMVILRLKKYFSSIATYLEPKNSIFDRWILFNFFFHTLKCHFRIQKWPFWRIQNEF